MRGMLAAFMAGPFPKAGEVRMHPRVKRIINVFLAGFAAVVPVVGTIWLVQLLYELGLRLGDKIIEGVLRTLNFLRGREGEMDPLVFSFPGDEFVRLAVPVLLLFALGFALANRPGKRLLAWFNRRMRAVPVLGFIYGTLAQFVDALKGLGSEQRKFKGVAYVEYPAPGSRLIGFITGNYRDAQTDRGVTSILIPTSPNPISGFVVIVDDDKVTKSDMTLEEASKMIVSAGLVTPASFEDEVV